MATQASPTASNDGWYFIGHASDFPNITSEDSGLLSDTYACGDAQKPGCKAFSVPKPAEDDSHAVEIDLSDGVDPRALKDQVLVFQYKGKFHAIDHRCPHSSYPLSNGSVFDIEDFGVVFSAGITCPKHSWSFDLFLGQADRGSYILRRWDVDLRPTSTESEATKEKESKEVWVRRKEA